MSNIPVFSIITICRNNLSGLQETYNSIINQTLKSFEWIVIDGNSTDGSITFIDNINPSYWVSEADNGPFDAMNKGIVACQAQYTIFLNAGDSLASEDVLENILNEIKGYNFLYGDSYEREDDFLKYKKSTHHKNIARKMFTHHQAMIYKTERLKQFLYNLDYKIAADFDLTQRYLDGIIDDQIKYWPHPICIFESGGLSQSNMTLGRKEQFLIRMANKSCRPFENQMMYGAQAANAALRQFTPWLYWLLKRAFRY